MQKFLKAMLWTFQNPLEIKFFIQIWFLTKRAKKFSHQAKIFAWRCENHFLQPRKPRLVNQWKKKSLHDHCVRIALGNFLTLLLFLDLYLKFLGYFSKMALFDKTQVLYEVLRALIFTGWSGLSVVRWSWDLRKIQKDFLSDTNILGVIITYLAWGSCGIFLKESIH